MPRLAHFGRRLYTINFYSFLPETVTKSTEFNILVGYQLNRMKDKIQHLKRGAFVLVAMMCGSMLAQGQNYDSIAIKYKDEHAVITNYTHRLVITFEDGKPVGKSYVTEERLLISDLAPEMYRTAYYPHNSKFDDMEDFDAWTYTPGKSGYKKADVSTVGDIRYPDDQTFYSDSWLRVVSYTGLVKKSRTEVRYIMNHEDGHMLPDFDFQKFLPVVKAKFEIVAPRYVTMNFALKGEHTDWIKQTKDEGNGTVTYTFTANDLPAYKKLEGVPSAAYYIPHVLPYITSYKHFNEDKPREWLANPAELYKYYYKNISHVNMVEDTALNKIVKEITRDDKTDREKAAHIYKWVQNNLHYIAFEDGLEGFVPRDAKLVCNRKYGDCKDMASIITAMCRKAGLDAHFTWVGTRSLPYTYEETPLANTDNHMISAVKIDNEWIFMDGTHATLPFGANRDDIQGKETLIGIDAKNYKIVTVPEAPASQNATTDSTFITFNEGQVQGRIKQNRKGYGSWNTRMTLRYFKNEERDKLVKEMMERGSNKYLQSQYKISYPDSVTKEMNIAADFTIDNYVNNAGKQYYINMNLTREFENLHIKTEDRTIPYYLNYKKKIKEVVVLDVPKGYKITYVPPAAKGKTDGLWSYNIAYTVAKDKKTITLVKEYELNTLAIQPKSFADNNKMVDAVKKAYKESVVLTAPRDVRTASK